MKTKRLIAILVCLALILAIVVPLFLSISALAAADYSIVRVKLSNANDGSLNLGIVGSYTLNPSGATVNRDIVLTAKGNSMVVNDKSTGENLYSGKSIKLVRNNSDSLIKMYSTVATAPCQYLGDFEVTINDGEFTVINHVPIEQYLYGVVAYEMSEKFPLEALKAQAVCARNYAIGRMAPKRSYDLGDTPNDQVYRGYDSRKVKVISAVDQTSGQILRYNGKAITAYFSASNGGQTERADNPWPNEVPYTTIKDDPYDIKNPDTPIQRLLFPETVNSQTPLNSKLETFLKDKVATKLGEMGYSTYSDQIQIMGIPSLEAHTTRYSKPTRNFKNAKATVAVRAVKTGTSKNSGNNVFKGDKPSKPDYEPLLDGAGNTIISSDGPLYYSKSSGNIITSNQYIAISEQYNASLNEWQSGSAGTSGSSGQGMSGQVDDLSVDIDFAIFDLKSEDLPYKAFTASYLVAYYTESAPGGTYLVNARYGHGVGMSQRGAQQMANEGWDYKRILDYYFVNCTWDQLNYSASIIGTGAGIATTPVTPSTIPETSGGDLGFTVDTSYKAPSSPSAPQVKSAVITAKATRGMSLMSSPTGGGAVTSVNQNDLLYVVKSVEGFLLVSDKAGNIGYIRHSDVLVDTSNGIMANANNNTPLYQLPGSGIVANVNAGDTLVLSGFDRGYYAAYTASSQTGFVNMDDVNLQITNVVIPLDSSKQFGITTKSTAIYSDKTKSKRLSTAPSGDIVEIKSKTKDGKLYNVVYGGTKGVIALKDVKLLQKGAANPNAQKALQSYNVTVNTPNANSANAVKVVSKKSIAPNTPFGLQSMVVEIDNQNTASENRSIIATVKATVNVRFEPSTQGRRIGAKYKGEQVELTGQTSDFYRIDYDGDSGYIAKEFIQVESDKVGEITSGVKLRSAPSTSSNDLGTLYRGEEVVLISKDNGFYYVSTPGGTKGYVSADFVKDLGLNLPAVKYSGSSASASSGSGSSAAVATGTTSKDVNLRKSSSTSSDVVVLLPSGTSVDIFAQTGDFFRVTSRSGSGYVSKSFISNIKPVSKSSSTSSSSSSSSSSSTSSKLGITSSSVKGRTESGRELFTLPKSEVVEIIGSSGDKFKVKYKNQIAFVQDSYLKVRDFSTASATESVRIRILPDVTSEAIGKLSTNDTMKVVSESGEWTKIYFEGINGYVMTQYIK